MLPRSINNYFNDRFHLFQLYLFIYSHKNWQVTRIIEIENSMNTISKYENNYAVISFTKITYQILKKKKKTLWNNSWRCREWGFMAASALFLFLLNFLVFFLCNRPSSRLVRFGEDVHSRGSTGTDLAGADLSERMKIYRDIRLTRYFFSYTTARTHVCIQFYTWKLSSSSPSPKYFSL